jgi:hypothetical protein
MTMRSSVRNLFNPPLARLISKGPNRVRPAMEALEDRTVLTTISGLARPVYLSGTTSFPTGNSGSVAVTSGLAKPPSTIQGFDGINAFESATANGFDVEPPDEGLAVGNGYVVNAVNDAIRVYGTSGTPLTRVVDLNSFFGLSPLPEVTDPSVYFDHSSQRWFADALTLQVDDNFNLTGPNEIDVAVSQTADPTGSWNIYRLPVQDDGTEGTPNHGDTSYSGPFLGDYPHIGADRNGIYITTNEYQIFGDGNFRGAQVYAFSKAALAAGASSLTVVQFDTGANPAGNPDGLAGFTLIPASTPDAVYPGAQGGTEYLLSSTDLTEGISRSSGNQLEIWALTNTKSLDSANPNLTLQGSAITVNTFSPPPQADQKAGVFPLGQSLADPNFVHQYFGPDATPTTEVEEPLDSIDTRMTQVTYANGKLWGAIDTAVNVGNTTKAGIAWYVINPQVNAQDVSGSLINQGTLALAGNNLIVPALGVTPSGKGVIGFTVAGQDYYPSTGYATLDAKSGTGPIQIAATGAGPEDGFAAYSFFGYDRPRWGDYSAAAVDGETVWLASEYIANSGTVAQYQADPTLGGTRSFYSNWDNRITPVSTSGNAGNSTTGTPAGGKAGATVTNSVININQVTSSGTGLVGGVHPLNSAVWDIANSLVNGNKGRERS